MFYQVLLFLWILVVLDDWLQSNVPDQPCLNLVTRLSVRYRAACGQMMMVSSLKLKLVHLDSIETIHDHQASMSFKNVQIISHNSEHKGNMCRLEKRVE